MAAWVFRAARWCCLFGPKAARLDPARNDAKAKPPRQFGGGCAVFVGFRIDSRPFPSVGADSARHEDLSIRAVPGEIPAWGRDLHRLGKVASAHDGGLPRRANETAEIRVGRPCSVVAMARHLLCRGRLRCCFWMAPVDCRSPAQHLRSRLSSRLSDPNAGLLPHNRT